MASAIGRVHATNSNWFQIAAISASLSTRSRGDFLELLADAVCGIAFDRFDLDAEIADLANERVRAVGVKRGAVFAHLPNECAHLRSAQIAEIEHPYRLLEPQRPQALFLWRGPLRGAALGEIALGKIAPSAHRANVIAVAFKPAFARGVTALADIGQHILGQTARVLELQAGKLAEADARLTPVEAAISERPGLLAGAGDAQCQGPAFAGLGARSACRASAAMMRVGDP